MISAFLTMIRGWPILAQFFFVIIIASLGTLVVLALIEAIREFVNQTLPTLFRGYPPSENEEQTDEETSVK
jgi:hypothetical protein